MQEECGDAGGGGGCDADGVMDILMLQRLV